MHSENLEEKAHFVSLSVNVLHIMISPMVTISEVIQNRICMVKKSEGQVSYEVFLKNRYFSRLCPFKILLHLHIVVILPSYKSN